MANEDVRSDRGVHGKALGMVGAVGIATGGAVAASVVTGIAKKKFKNVGTKFKDFKNAKHAQDAVETFSGEVLDAERKLLNAPKKVKPSKASKEGAIEAEWRDVSPNDHVILASIPENLDEQSSHVLKTNPTQ